MTTRRFVGARRVGGALKGAAFGLGAGTVWALVEATVIWASGGIAPPSVVRTVVALDLLGGGMVGAMAGAVAPAIPGSVLGLVATLAYGFARIVAPPGLGAEALYAAGAVAMFAVGRGALAGTAGFAGGLHVVMVGTLGLLLGELWLDGHHASALRGFRLPLVCLGLPAAALLIDRLLAVTMPRRGVRVAGTIAALAAFGFWAGSPLDAHPREDALVTGVPPPSGSPDVVLVSLDTTRADRLSTYGYERETSPNLTRLAADGELYRTARSPAGWTLPAHASLLTGRFPRSHGAHLAEGLLAGDSVDGRPQVAHPLRDDAVTAAELLRDHGYETGAFVANFSYLYRDYGLAQGFDVYDDAPGIIMRVRPPMARLARQVEPSFAVKPFRSAREINAAALAWLDARPAGRPAFLFVNYMEPHQPWVAEPPWDRWARGLPGAGALARKNLYTHAVRPIDAETARFIGAHYDGQVAAMDAALGELLDALRARGRYANALVIVFGDHGELLGEHGQMGHMGRMLYEPLLRVPLVVKRPGAPRPRVVDGPVQLVDVLPTLAAVVGAKLPDGVEGTPLDRVARPSYAEEGINPFLVRRYGAAYDRAVRVVYDGPFKLISTSRGERMLFDLDVDPGEIDDLAGRHPDRVQELSQRLELRAPHLAAAESTEKVQ